MFNLNPALLADFYKISHRIQYPVGTEKIYSTWTPRMSRIARVDEVVVFGIQAMCLQLLYEFFNDNFFNKPKEEIVNDYTRTIKHTLGVQSPDTKHIEDLHDLGYLPIKVMAIREGVSVPLRCPMMTIENTNPKYFWLTNFLETIISNYLWKPMTSATIARQYRKILDFYAQETSSNPGFVQFQGHDFSMRGMSGLESAITSGAGHLTSFVGTDTIPAIPWLEKYYKANIETELVGCSVNATEHSVMCASGSDDEFGTYKRLINDVYPTGIVSIVSDTWDLWHVITDTLPKLKSDIMNRDGKVVIRPDSGDPVDIICGTAVVREMSDDEFIDLDHCCRYLEEEIVDEVRESTPHGERGEGIVSAFFRYKGKTYKITIDIYWNRYDKQYYFIDDSEVLRCEEAVLEPSQKGVVELLWEIFGGHENSKGYKELDMHIGAIYGDAITIERAEEICKRLKDKGFASTNVVLGVGSYTYQYNTRDTFGFALKSTYAVINGEEKMIFKNPATDIGSIKKSQCGLVVVRKSKSGELSFDDKLNRSEFDKVTDNQMVVAFQDGIVKTDYLTRLSEVRKRILKPNLKMKEIRNYEN